MEDTAGKLNSVESGSELNNQECTVLVCVGERRRPLKLASPTIDALKEGVINECCDILPQSATRSALIFQVQDIDWGGIFVDIRDKTRIVDRSIINVICTTKDQTSSSPGPESQPIMYLQSNCTGMYKTSHGSSKQKLASYTGCICVCFDMQILMHLQGVQHNN